MSNVLLVEPSYRSKFPPLGLLRISTYHKGRGDAVTFVRGKDPVVRSHDWHRVYVSSLFTYELPRTVDTIAYYSRSVSSWEDIIVGGIGVTLRPDFVRDRVACRIVPGRLETGGELGDGSPPLPSLTPDYGLLESCTHAYVPKDSYFCRVTVGCIRHCSFCAVPTLEPRFAFEDALTQQIDDVDAHFGPRHDLVLLDNNLLATKVFPEVVAEIIDCGFGAGSKRDGRRRTVDMNQGIDARLITPKTAKLLASINIHPVRLAYDTDGIAPAYRRAVRLLSDEGLRHFTNYVLFNYDDDPSSLYRRLSENLSLRDKHGVSITGFPMKYVPISSVDRTHVAPGWTWRHLRGVQCILLATHGMVSPSRDFFEAAFGESAERFREILAMPDDYIIHREQHRDDGAADWLTEYRKLTDSEVDEFLALLEHAHQDGIESTPEALRSRYAALLAHYEFRNRRAAQSGAQLQLSE